MSKSLKTSFSILTDTNSTNSIADEMNKYILIMTSVRLKVGVDLSFRTYLYFLKNEYSKDIIFLPDEEFQSITKRIGSVTYLIADISFQKRTIQLSYQIGGSEYWVTYKFVGNEKSTKIEVRHVAKISDYRWGLPGTFGKFEYKRDYRAQIKVIKNQLEYYISKEKFFSTKEYQELVAKFNKYIGEKYNVDILKNRLIELISLSEINPAQKKEIKKINKTLKKIGFL